MLAILLIIAGTSIGLWIGQRENSQPLNRDDSHASTNALSDQEALAEWERLHALWRRAYTERDPSLISLFRAPDAPKPFNEVDSEIAYLNRANVLDKTAFEQKELEVLSNERDEVIVRESTIIHPKFVDEETGDDITVGDKPGFRTVEWTMRRYAGAWKFYTSEITQARILRSREK